MSNHELLEVLTKALPYVERAYECAFPDQAQNDYLAQNIKDAIEEIVMYCKDPDASAMRVLQQQGYNNIKMTGHKFFMCGDNDVYARGFTAYTKDSILVKGCVCSGINKGYTIRFE